MERIYRKCILKFIKDLNEHQLKTLYLLAQRYWARGVHHE